MGEKVGGISQMAIKLIQTGSGQNGASQRVETPRPDGVGLQQSIGRVAVASEGVKVAVQEAAKLSVRASNRSQPVRDPSSAGTLASNIASDVARLDKEDASSVHNLTSSAVDPK